MRPHRHHITTVCAAGSMALLLAACSSGPGASANSGTTSTGSAGSTSKTATVKLSSEPGVGKVLVTSGGQALYLFTKDDRGEPTCTGSCAQVWLPLSVSKKPVAGTGVQPGLLGTVKEGNGKLQVTYNRWPLYTFSADTSSGEVHGEGLQSFGGRWWAVTASGTEASTHTSSPTGSSGYGSTSPTTTSGSGGYGY